MPDIISTAKNAAAGFESGSNTGAAVATGVSLGVSALGGVGAGAAFGAAAGPIGAAAGALIGAFIALGKAIKGVHKPTIPDAQHKLWELMAAGSHKHIDDLWGVYHAWLDYVREHPEDVAFVDAVWHGPLLKRHTQSGRLALNRWLALRGQPFGAPDDRWHAIAWAYNHYRDTDDPVTPEGATSPFAPYFTRAKQERARRLATQPAPTDIRSAVAGRVPLTIGTVGPVAYGYGRPKDISSAIGNKVAHRDLMSTTKLQTPVMSQALALRQQNQQARSSSTNGLLLAAALAAAVYAL